MGAEMARLLNWLAYWLAWGAVAAFANAGMASDGGVKLHWPVKCTEGVDCLVQQYMDLESGPAIVDPYCGERAYDGHQGVDIRLISFRDLARDVRVIAAADGVVTGVRNKMPDRRWTDRGLTPRPDDGMGCGNGLVIAHSGGFETQYCHLKQGSVVVRIGQKVNTGQHLGNIGLSGDTAFPHLHFMARINGQVVDPYTGARLGTDCGAGEPLWAETQDYQSVTMIDAGFTDHTPRYASARMGKLADRPLGPDAVALVLWTRLIGLRRGDVARLEIWSPDGALISENEEIMEKNSAVQFLYSGRKRWGEAWREGAYKGRISLMRDGATILTRERVFTF